MTADATLSAERIAIIKAFLRDCDAIAPDSDPVGKLVKTVRECLASHAALSARIAELEKAARPVIAAVQKADDFPSRAKPSPASYITDAELRALAAAIGRG